MDLGQCVPRETLSKMFGDVREEVLADSAYALTRDLAHEVPPICLFIWDEMVHRGRVQDGEKMRTIYPDKQDRIYQFVKRELGAEPIADAYFANFYNEISEDEPFVRVELCQCYPNDLHISDLEFADNRRPVVDNSDVAPRAYHGLHIFPEFLDRLRAIAIDRKVERISLVAASPATHEVFTRYGFQVSPTPVGQFAFRELGFSHPMFLPV